jgi:hypothetical protein
MLPRVALLTALVDHLAAGVAALPEADRFKLRHHRHRDTAEEEMPCVAVRFVSDDVPGNVSGSDAYPSMSEAIMELGVDLVADVQLPAEAAPGQSVDAGDDPTGLLGPSMLIERLLRMLFAVGEPPTTLGGLAWDIRYEGTGDDPDSSPDSARIVERLVLVYRVRREAPTELLTGN